MWRKWISVKRLRLGIATWTVLLGALATLPLCAFVYASYQAELGQLRADADVVYHRQAAAAAMAMGARLEALASHLHLIGELAAAGDGQVRLPAAAVVPGLTGIRRAPVPLGASVKTRTTPAGTVALAGPSIFLSPFFREGDDEFAVLSVRVPGARGAQDLVVAGKVSLSTLRGEQGLDASLSVFLVDQVGTGVVLGRDGGAQFATFPPQPPAGNGGGAIGAPLSSAEVLGVWRVAVAGQAADLSAREAEVRDRFLWGGVISFLLGLLLFHVAGKRLRRQIDSVASDFSDLDSPPSTIISEFAELGDALASARASVGQTAMELERARHDALTGLPGRELFLERAEAQVHAARGMDDYGIALLYIDLDGFKAVNDTFGHKAGDELLLKVAASLRECVRTPDVVARVGGDEFVVCIAAPRALLEDLAARAAQRIQQSVAALEPGVGCSIGWATSSPDCDLVEVIDRADSAMYLTKAGRKRRAEALGH